MKEKAQSKADSETKSGVPWLRMMLRVVLVTGTMVLVRYLMTNRGSTVLASSKQFYDKVNFDLPCSNDYNAERLKFQSKYTTCTSLMLIFVI